MSDKWAEHGFKQGIAKPLLCTSYVVFSGLINAYTERNNGQSPSSLSAKLLNNEQYKSLGYVYNFCREFDSNLISLGYGYFDHIDFNEPSYPIIQRAWNWDSLCNAVKDLTGDNEIISYFDYNVSLKNMYDSKYARQRYYMLNLMKMKINFIDNTYQDISSTFSYYHNVDPT